MSLFTRHATIKTTAEDLIAERRSLRTKTVPHVNSDTAMRHSAVWAALVLRADLISMMPIDVFRVINDVQIELPKPAVLIEPGGETCRIKEWMYSTQIDLDRAGNVFGVITGRDGMGKPRRIELAPLAEVSVRCKGNKIEEISIAGERFAGERLRDVWHEKQYTVAGLPVGLSPVAYAALTIGEYLSVSEFALDWFGGGIPNAVLKNTKKTVSSIEARKIKERYKAVVAAGDVFVHGMDWEFKPIDAVASQTDWIDVKEFNLTDISRFFRVPADLLDAAVSTGSVTYANITQRNLQFLIMNLGPAVGRREDALSTLLPAPRFVKLNTDAILRMDPETSARTLKIEIDSRQIAPSEARRLKNRPPFTEEQLQEFDRLFGVPRQQQPTPVTSGVSE